MSSIVRPSGTELNESTNRYWGYVALGLAG